MRPVRQAHPTALVRSHGCQAYDAAVTSPRPDARTEPRQEGGPNDQSAAAKAPANGSDKGPGRTKAPAKKSAAGRTPAEHMYDVVVVGGGPAGSSCAYWLADAGWDVVVVEKKTFPREKTCGDGLTPRAVRQLADMGLEEALAGSHRYSGLRAYGFGQSLEMPWPEHPDFPGYGYTITRHDLDGLVADRAAEAGATLLQGTEVVEPLVGRERRRHRAPAQPDRGHRARRRRLGCDPDHQGPLRRGGRRVELAGRARARHGPAAGAPHGHGAARLLPLGPPRRPLHRVAPRHPGRATATWFRATAGSSRWATAG